MTQETLPAPVEIPTLEGEVIDPAQQLKEHEANIRKNFRKMETVVGSVARSLNVIYHNNLWKLHRTADGKRRYTNFNDYLTEEFGWDKTAARARQIMKADLPLAIEAGEVPAEVGDKRRERAAPEVTAVRAAKVTKKQIEGVIEAWAKRMDTVESGLALEAFGRIFDDSEAKINAILDTLDDFIGQQEAEADVADESEEAVPA